MSMSYTTLGLHTHRDFHESLSLMNLVSLPTLFCDSHNALEVLLAKKEGKLPHLSTMVVKGRLSSEEKKLSKSLLTVRKLKLVKNSEVCVNYPESSSVYTLGVTDGTTGEPKVFQVTHRNLMASIVGAYTNGFDISHNDTYFSYTPLSVQVERTAIYTLSKFGAKIAMGSGEISNIPKELQDIKPTIMMSIPVMLEKIYASLNTEFGKLTGFNRVLFSKALTAKLKKYEKTGGLIHKVYDKIVFKKARESLGGRLRLIIFGESHIGPDIVKMLRIYLSCAILEGYGLAEACSFNLSSVAGDSTDGHQGGPLGALQVRLWLRPDLQELHQGTVGELCVRGDCVCTRYCGGSEICDAEGWVRTGDVFTIMSRGNALKFIDRLENIVNIAGNLVAIGRTQAIYRLSKFVEQVMIVKNGNEELAAVVVPDEKFLISICNSNYTSYAELLRNKKLKEMIEEDLNEIAMRLQLPQWLLLKNIHIEVNPWKSDAFLTARHKKKRFILEKRYLMVINNK